ncbi:hypothetical protein ACJIZ3_011624 [Penstemon smallii]|uniref:RING-type E3 ubiquitin transferase n=1 Tax=Penstemon smallii TaxID=265156 RepID=A0ABD3UN63_9LAMI
MEDGNPDSINSALNGRMMILSVIILIIACFIIVIFHLYARLFHNRHRRRQFHHHNRLRHLITPTTVLSPQGLDLRFMNSLPTFFYESKTHESPLECAVCLSEFEENEMGRVLPECKHCFHVDCIDMWLQFHGDCPLCRSPVKFNAVESPVEPIEDPNERIVPFNESEDTGFGSSPICEDNVIQMGCTSSSSSVDIKQPELIRTSEQDPIESDIESGPRQPGSSVRVLKRLFSI